MEGSRSKEDHAHRQESVCGGERSAKGREDHRSFIPNQKGELWALFSCRGTLFHSIAMILWLRSAQQQLQLRGHKKGLRAVDEHVRNAGLPVSRNLLRLDDFRVSKWVRCHKTCLGVLSEKTKRMMDDHFPRFPKRGCEARTNFARCFCAECFTVLVP